jgi:hypothetical protein
MYQMEVNGQFEAPAALSWEKSPWSSMDMRLGGAQSGCWRSGEQASSSPNHYSLHKRDLKFSWRHYIMKSFRAICCVNAELVSDVSGTVSITPRRESETSENSQLHRPQYYINRNSYNNSADETRLTGKINSGRRAALVCSNINTEVRIPLECLSVIFWPVRILLQMIYCGQSQYITLERFLSNCSHVSLEKQANLEMKLLLSLWCTSVVKICPKIAYIYIYIYIYTVKGHITFPLVEVKLSLCLTN